MTEHHTPISFRNRIVGHDNVAPGDLLANPLNARGHPQRQQAALNALLGEVGWVGSVLVNRNSGQVVDGHLRVQLALRNNEPTIPVTYVDLTPEEEVIALAAFDEITGMAFVDAERMAILAGVAKNHVHDESLAALFESIGQRSRAQLDGYDRAMGNPGDGDEDSAGWDVCPTCGAKRKGE